MNRKVKIATFIHSNASPVTAACGAFVGSFAFTKYTLVDFCVAMSITIFVALVWWLGKRWATNTVEAYISTIIERQVAIAREANAIAVAGCKDITEDNPVSQ